MAYRTKKARYKDFMRRGSPALAGAVSSAKSRARKLYGENKKKTMIFTGALLAGVAAYALGYINFSNPAKKV